MVILQKRVGGLSGPALARFVARAQKAAGLRGTVHVLVTTSRELRALNRRFRGKDKPTDVLSFPPLLGRAKDFAGDMAISAELAAQNARRLGHSPLEEIKVLALHGVLHLAGYDHECDQGEMARKEERLRRALRLPVSLIERNGVRPAAGRKALNRRERGEVPRRAQGKTAARVARPTRARARRTR